MSRQANPHAELWKTQPFTAKRNQPRQVQGFAARQQVEICPCLQREERNPGGHHGPAPELPEQAQPLGDGENRRAPQQHREQKDIPFNPPSARAG